MRRIISYLLLALILVIGAGIVYFIYFFEYPQITRLQNVHVKELVGSHLKLEAEIGVYNPNFLSPNLKDLDALLSLEDSPIAQIQQGDAFTVNAQDTTFIPLDIDLDLTQLSPLYPQLTSRQETQAHIVGEVKWLTFLGAIPSPFKKDLPIDVNAYGALLNSSTFMNPLFKIEDVKIKSELSASKVSLNIRLMNPFNFDYGLSNLEMNLSLGEKSTTLGSWEIEGEHLVKAQSSKSFPLEFTINHSRLMLSGLAASKDIAVLMQGQCEITIGEARFPLPIRYSWDIPLL